MKNYFNIQYYWFSARQQTNETNNSIAESTSTSLETSDGVDVDSAIW